MKLFTPLRLRGIEFKNRIAVSPMCEYSAEDGHPGTWHLVHLGSRAVGGAALVMGEATAVQAIGRISPGDTGLYLDSQAEAWVLFHGQPISAGIPHGYSDTHHANAISSISTLASIISRASMVDLAGGSFGKYWPNTLFMPAKSFRSAKKTVVFTTRSIELPAASRTAFRFCRTLSVWAVMSPSTSFPVAGSAGTKPEQYTMPPAFTA